MNTQTGLLNKLKRTKANKTSKDPAVSNPSETTKKTFITIPYCAGVSERVKKIYKLFDIATGFKPVNKLRGQLVHVKDKPQKTNNLTLSMGTSVLNRVALNLTLEKQNSFKKTRIGQHRRPSLSDCQPDSAVYAHAKSTGHQIDPEEVIILDREERWFERGVWEAIWERIEQPSLNKRGGLRFQLSNTWNQSLNDVTRRLSRRLPINRDFAFFVFERTRADIPFFSIE